MRLQIDDTYVPGTKLKKEDVGGATGIALLEKVFFVSEGVMLTQIRDVSGVDGSTLQNWTKRGWVENSKLKKYNVDQVAHILIINMLRSCMQLDKIAFLIGYINGRVDDRSDDIIPDSRLYDYICRILDRMMDDDVYGANSIREVIAAVTADYVEPITGARERLSNGLEVIVYAYYATVIKRHSDALIDRLADEAQKQ